MPARVPLDVDLEDRLLYGLTPIRLAYMVIAVLTGLAVWSSSWVPIPVRAGAALACVVLGSGVSWGTWRGRAADAWIVDVVAFMTRTHKVAWNWKWLHSRGRQLAADDVTETEAPEAAGSLAT